jgi:hypothetical protein
MTNNDGYLRKHVSLPAGSSATPRHGGTPLFPRVDAGRVTGEREVRSGHYAGSARCWW